MKILLILFIFTLSGSAQIIEKTENKNNESVEVIKPKLIADLEIVKKNFCKPNAYSLEARLKYKNIGTVNVLLYKYSPIELQEKISKVDLNGKLQLYSTGTATLVFNLYEKPDLKEMIDTKTEDYFVTLAPGESYEINDLHFILPPFIKEGEYVIEKTYIVFPFSPNVIRELQKVLEKRGVIWDENLNTNPLTFTVENLDQDLVKNCKKIKY